jgi:hypothetical protein
VRSSGSSGILGIENRKPNIFFLSFPAGNYQKKQKKNKKKNNSFFFERSCHFRADAAHPCRRISPSA